MAEPRAGRVVRRPPGFAGCLGAVVLLGPSLTPSLLPRHWALQAVVSGLAMVSGYGVGAAIGAAVRRLRPARPPVGAWVALAVGAVVLVVMLFPVAADWQRQGRDRLGISPEPWPAVPVLLGAVLVALVPLLAARLVRLVTRRLTAVFAGRVHRPAAALVAAVVVASTGHGAGTVLFDGAVNVAGEVAEAVSQRRAASATPPSSPYQSGGPGSWVPWHTLGAAGQAFVTGAGSGPGPGSGPGSGPGPASGSRAGVASRPGVASGPAAPDPAAGPPPIRVYVGAASAPSPAARAELAVRELARTGAFDRRVLGVIVPTGTGWVNPAAAGSLERLSGGDSALVAMQYSYLPSWLLFLSERSAAVAAARELLSAVRERVARLPVDRRPRLVVYGESLGAYAAAAALAEPAPAAPGRRLADVDRVVLSGPPFGARPGIRRSDLPVTYLCHPDDPIVRWTPRLLYHPPDWLGDDQEPALPPAMRWFPVVTFWQVTVDLLVSTGVPDGHGHSYGAEIADAWAETPVPTGGPGAGPADGCGPTGWPGDPPGDTVPPLPDPPAGAAVHPRAVPVSRVPTRRRPLAMPARTPPCCLLPGGGGGPVAPRAARDTPDSRGGLDPHAA